MSEEEEKWEGEARKEADILYITKPVKMAYIQGYLQACKVRREEIENLKEENTKLRNELFRQTGPTPSDDQ